MAIPAISMPYYDTKSPEPWFRAFALTIPPKWDILSIESGATGRRFPQSCYKEVTAGLRDGRLLLFIIHDLNDQCDKSDDEGTKLKQLGPCNHIAHPLFLGIGGKEDYPRRTGEPPTVTGSTADRISQKFDKCKSRPSVGRASGWTQPTITTQRARNLGSGLHHSSVIGLTWIVQVSSIHSWGVLEL